MALPTTIRDQALTQGDLRRFYNGQHRFYAGIDLHARFLQVLPSRRADQELATFARNVSPPF